SLELRKRRLENIAGSFTAKTCQEIDRHVVSRFERGIQRIGAPGREPSDGGRIEARLPHHHRVSFNVDTTSSSTSGELGVLPRCDVLVRFTIELHESFDHDGTCWHVDTERECLGSKDRLDKTGGKEFFDNFFEQWK